MKSKSTVLGLAAAVTAFAFSNCRSAELIVSIADARGQPVSDAVVLAMPISPSIRASSSGFPGSMVSALDTTLPAAAALAASTAAKATAQVVIDQIDLAFVPAVTVVRTGTSVTFPNSDTVAHQVYSFSAAKRFELPLYRGHAYPPILLDRPGLIVLGCNIHDSMVGYVLVTDAPYFGKTDDHGDWRNSKLPPGEYELSIWSARLPRGAALQSQRIELDKSAPVSVEVRLQHVLRPPAVTRPDPAIRDY